MKISVRSIQSLQRTNKGKQRLKMTQIFQAQFLEPK